MNARRVLLAILGLTLLVYLPGVIRNDFVSLDDILLITNNDKVHGFSPEHLWRAFTSYDPELYVPLTLFTYQMEYTIAGLHPFLYHLDNLLLHLGSIVLVYACTKHIVKICHPEPVEGRHVGANVSMVRQAYHDTLLPLFCAAIFALHPLNVEAVSWAAARKDVLSGFLMLVSLWGFLRFRESEDPKWYKLSLTAFGCALLAKVSVILLPVSFLLLDAQQGNFRLKKGSKEFAPFAAFMLVAGTIALFGKTAQMDAMGFADQILLSCKALAMMIGKFLFPIGLTAYYPQVTPVTANLFFVLFVLFVFVLLIAVWKLRRTLPLFTWGIAFFLLAMLPSFMNFLKKGMLFVTSDRYAYIGMIGLTLALGSLLYPLHKRISEYAAQIVGCLALCVLAGASLVQAQTWKDSIALYESALAVHPKFAPALNNLGAAVYMLGETDRSLALYEEAIASDPTLTSGYNNIALHRRKKGDLAGALSSVKTGLSMIPPNRRAFEEEITAWSLLGSLLDERGESDAALAAFAKGAKRAPESPDARYNYGVSLQKRGMREEARRELLAYLNLRSSDIEARYRLAAIEAELGLLTEALQNLAIIVSRDPTYEKAAEHLERIQAILRQ